MNIGYNKVFCRGCQKKGIKKVIELNKLELCIECRSSPCTKCGTMTTSTKGKCFKCNKPSAYANAKERREKATQRVTK